MEQSQPNPIIDDLIAKATSAIEETALRLSDAIENLEDLELLTALGALSGCEENIRNASIIIRVIHEYRQKQTRALDLGADMKTPSEGPTSSPTDSNKISNYAAREAYVLKSEYDALPPVDIIASGYEFDCPSCATYNTLIAIPKHSRAVECHACHAQFRVDESTHAQA